MNRLEDEDIQAMLISMSSMRLEGVPLPDVGHGQALEITSCEGNPQTEPVYLGIRERFFRGRYCQSIEPGPITGLLITTGSKQPAKEVTLELKSLRD